LCAGIFSEEKTIRTKNLNEEDLKKGRIKGDAGKKLFKRNILKKIASGILENIGDKKGQLRRKWSSSRGKKDGGSGENLWKKNLGGGLGGDWGEVQVWKGGKKRKWGS